MAKTSVQLASGHSMPLVGFGLWKVPAEKAADTVYNVSSTCSQHNVVTDQSAENVLPGYQSWLQTV